MSVSLCHTATRAASSTSFRGLLCKWQITHSDAKLHGTDFTFHPRRMVVSIHKSKTIQFSHCQLLISTARVANTSICAVHWVQRHFREVAKYDDSPGSLVPSTDGLFYPLSYSALQSTIKCWATCCGLDANDYSCHSLHRGRCITLVMQGASLKEIKTRGDWSSDTVFQYICSPLLGPILAVMRVLAALVDTL